ncbi:MAG: transketolase, partial [Proteobacteria bacterium]|nr:transketolase [Pseudomonadota bacterium]
MRDAFVARLEELAKTDPRIMLLTGDLGFGVLDNFS